MAAQWSDRDPRSVITPDAFEVSGDLLGLRLAPPGRRLVAILVDLAVIGVITAVTRSVSLILGIVAAVLFIRAGLRRAPPGRSAVGRAMRASTGCLGVVIAIATATLWASFGIGGRGGRDNEGVEPSLSPAAISRAPETLSAVADPAERIEPRDAAAIRDEVSLYTTEEALGAYALLLASGRTGDMDLVRRGALETRLGVEIAADTLRALQTRIAGLEEDARERQRELQRSTAALEEASTGGVIGFVRSLVDELGFGFGWASLYMTVMLSWWEGQTFGKRLMRIRVLRLDGEAITWWVAFERAGGYAAGLATGLLGFAQVFWDANRQAIHDRIVGTVVVQDGVVRPFHWESPL